MARKVLEPQNVIKNLHIVTKNLVNTDFVGKYKSVFKGRGLDFEGYRDYTPADDARFIDWNASLRAQRLIIKQFAEERNLQVFFLIDVSNSMIFGSTKKLKNEVAAELVASLSYAVLEGSDSVGYGLFAEKVHHFVYPSFGTNQFLNILDGLSNYKNYGGGFDLTMGVRYLLSFLKKQTLVIIVSDFLGLKKDWETALRLASKKFDLIGIQVQDPRDQTLPEDVTQVVLQDPFSDKIMMVDPKKIKKKYEAYARQQQQNIKQQFGKINADYLYISTEKPFIYEIIKFFKARARRIR